MEEQVGRRREEDGSSPAGLGGLGLGSGSQGGTVTVMNGPYAEQLSIGGITVGEVRNRYQARFDIDPQSLAVLDGDLVDDETVIRAGQLLRFSRKAGEKGTLFDFDALEMETLKERLARPPRTNPTPKGEVKVELSGSLVSATTPEDERRTLGIDDVISRLAPEGMSSGDIVLPDGVKAVVSEGPATLWMHQTSPRVHNFRWIADDSPIPYGADATYREVKIALPYVIVMATFLRDPRGKLRLTHANECFFRNEPVRSLDDELSFPALLNCSKHEKEEGNPLAWICTQYLNLPESQSIPDENLRMRGGLDALLQCLFDTAFNYSSDHHEGSSWFTASRTIDPRIESIERWEAATKAEPDFATDVAWLPTGLSVREIAERMIGLRTSRRRRRRTAADVARVVLNHGDPPETDPPEQSVLELEVAS